MGRQVDQEGLIQEASDGTYWRRESTDANWNTATRYDPPPEFLAQIKRNDIVLALQKTGTTAKNIFQNYIDPGSWSTRGATGAVLAATKLAPRFMGPVPGALAKIGTSVLLGAGGGAAGGLIDEPSLEGAKQGAMTGAGVGLGAGIMGETVGTLQRWRAERMHPTINRFAEAVRNVLGMTESDISLEGENLSKAFKLEDQPGGFKHALLKKYKDLRKDIFAILDKNGGRMVPDAMIADIPKEHFPPKLRALWEAYEKRLAGWNNNINLIKGRIIKRRQTLAKNLDPGVQKALEPQLAEDLGTLKSYNAVRPTPPQATLEEVEDTMTNLRQGAWDAVSGETKNSQRAGELKDLHRNLGQRLYSYVEEYAGADLSKAYAKSRKDQHGLEDVYRIINEAHKKGGMKPKNVDPHILRDVHWDKHNDLYESFGESGAEEISRSLFPGKDTPTLTTGQPSEFHAYGHGGLTGKIGSLLRYGGHVGHTPKSPAPTLTSQMARGLTAQQLSQLINKMRDEFTSAEGQQ